MEERRTLDPDAWRFEPSPRSLKAQLTMGACLAAECPSLPHVNGLSTRARWWREGANSVDNATATLWTVVAAGGGAVLAGLVSSVATYLVTKRNLSERVGRRRTAAPSRAPSPPHSGSLTGKSDVWSASSGLPQLGEMDT